MKLSFGQPSTMFTKMHLHNRWMPFKVEVVVVFGVAPLVRVCEMAFASSPLKRYKLI